MRPRYIQVSCSENDRIDPRQSRAVLKYRPDLIFLEYPGTAVRPITTRRRFGRRVIKRSPWVASDNAMWENIAKLWKSGHETLVYAVDGPGDLVRVADRYPYDRKYPHKTTNVLWWVRIYLRERFMADKIRSILRRHARKSHPMVLVFLQKFHWRHVRFLLSGPSRKEIRRYYFGRFRKLSSKDVARLVKEEDRILWKYWNSPMNPLRASADAR